MEEDGHARKISAIKRNDPTEEAKVNCNEPKLPRCTLHSTSTASLCHLFFQSFSCSFIIERQRETEHEHVCTKSTVIANVFNFKV